MIRTEAAARPGTSPIHDHEPALLQPMSLPALAPEPTVSVIMSNYNYARFISRALDSVLAQTYPRFEVLVCDDGSTDNSRAVIERFAGRDARIVPIYQENRGQAAAWNAAYARARGEIISFLDSDDEFLPQRLERVVAAFDAQPHAGLVYHRLLPVSENGLPVGEPFQRYQTDGWLAESALQHAGLFVNGVTSSGLSLRRELADIVFPMPEVLRRGFSDAYIQAVAQFLTEFVAIPDALTAYRIHGENYSVATRPTARSTAAMLDGHRDAYPYIHDFIEARFGSSLASRVRLEDSDIHWEYLAANYVLSGKPAAGVYGHRPHEILSHLRPPRVYLWRTIFGLPGSLSAQALQWWWGQARWKRLTRPVTSRLRLG